MASTGRSLLLGAAVLAGCSARPPAPAASVPAAQSEASVIIREASAGETRLFVSGESGAAAALALTPVGAHASFGAVLAGRRIAYGLEAADGSLTQARAVSVDGTGDALAAFLPAGRYSAVRTAVAVDGGALLLEAARADGSGSELLLASGGSASHVGSGRLLHAGSGVALYLAHPQSSVDQIGDVRSVHLDGSGDAALGGGDSDDQFHGISGSVALVTVHRSGAAAVRAIPLDGSAATVRAGSRGVLFDTASGALVAARADGTLERLDGLSATALQLPAGATPLALLPDGRVAAFVAGRGVVAADGRGSATLDSFAADSALSAQVVHSKAGDRLVYTANSAAGSALRSARLDGTAAATLGTGLGQELRFNSPLPGDRVLFYRTKGTEPGGWLSTAALAGGDEKLVGDAASGTLNAADHDYGGVTRAGRLVFEAEVVERAPPRLFVVEDGAVRGLTATQGYATLAAVIE